MKYFSQVTSGNTVLMGSKTFESIGKPLKNRYNIVITKNPEKYRNRKEKNLNFTTDWKETLKPYKKSPGKHIFVIGGQEIYLQTYDLADYYYVSIVKGIYKGNVYFSFPDWKENKKLENYSLERLFEGCELTKKRGISGFYYLCLQEKTIA